MSSTTEMHTKVHAVDISRLSYKGRLSNGKEDKQRKKVHTKYVNQIRRKYGRGCLDDLKDYTFVSLLSSTESSDTYRACKKNDMNCVCVQFFDIQARQEKLDSETGLETEMSDLDAAKAVLKFRAFLHTWLSAHGLAARLTPDKPTVYRGVRESFTGVLCFSNICCTFWDVVVGKKMTTADAKEYQFMLTTLLTFLQEESVTVGTFLLHNIGLQVVHDADGHSYYVPRIVDCASSVMHESGNRSVLDVLTMLEQCVVNQKRLEKSGEDARNLKYIKDHMLQIISKNSLLDKSSQLKIKNLSYIRKLLRLEQSAYQEDMSYFLQKHVSFKVGHSADSRPPQPTQSGRHDYDSDYGDDIFGKRGRLLGSQSSGKNYSDRDVDDGYMDFLRPRHGRSQTSRSSPGFVGPRRSITVGRPAKRPGDDDDRIGEGGDPFESGEGGDPFADVHGDDDDRIRERDSTGGDPFADARAEDDVFGNNLQDDVFGNNLQDDMQDERWDKTSESDGETEVDGLNLNDLTLGDDK